MSAAKVTLTAILMLGVTSGCDDGEQKQNPTPTQTSTPVPYGNKDPRKGKVKLDRVCGFWSCQETSMVCIGSTLILTPADGSTPVRVADAMECKP